MWKTANSATTTHDCQKPFPQRPPLCIRKSAKHRSNTVPPWKNGAPTTLDRRRSRQREPSDWLKGGHLVIPPDEMLRVRYLQLLYTTPQWLDIQAEDETPHPSLPFVLVARDAHVGRRLRCGMRQCANRTKISLTTRHPAVSHPHPGKHAPISNRSPCVMDCHALCR